MLIRFRLWDNDESAQSTGWLIDDIEVKDKDSLRIPFPFFDKFEGSLSNWIVSGRDWSLTTADSRSTSHSVASNYVGNYPPNANETLELAHPLDLSGATTPILSFWHKYNLAFTYTSPSYSDNAYVELSLDQGVTWTLVKQFTKTSLTWTQVQVDLTPYKSSSVLIRFRLWDDPGSAQSTGWLIDDISIYDTTLYALTVTKVGAAGDTVTPDIGSLVWSDNVGTVSYNGSTIVTLSAQAGLGSAFVGWSGDCSGTGSCSVTMSQSKNVTAQFAYTINASVNGGTGGSITPISSIVIYGNPITFNIMPNSDYSLKSLTDNGTPVFATPAGNGYTYTITNVTENHHLQATFSSVAAAPVPALNPVSVVAAGLALCGMLWRKKK